MIRDVASNANQFNEIVTIIDKARARAFRAVNAELINMYWEIGAYVSQCVKNSDWGKSIVSDFAAFLQSHYPAVKGVFCSKYLENEAVL